MNKFIKLTNASDFHKGNTIYVNMEHITVIHEMSLAEDRGLATILYSIIGDKQWEVSESPKEVIQLLKDNNYDS